tara:strand:- start:577 stop:972 length:396 start_codon:yes stop_codon:yes gene_type:complete
MQNIDNINWLVDFKWNYSFNFYPFYDRETNITHKMKNLHKNKLVDSVFYAGMISTRKEKVLMNKGYNFLYYIVLFSGQENDWTDSDLANILGTHDSRVIKNFDIVKDRRKTCDDITNQMTQKNYRFCDLIF